MYEKEFEDGGSNGRDKTLPYTFSIVLSCPLKVSGSPPEKSKTLKKESPRRVGEVSLSILFREGGASYVSFLHPILHHAASKPSPESLDRHRLVRLDSGDVMRSWRHPGAHGIRSSGEFSLREEARSAGFS